jgi:hypothetical protein
VLAVLRALPLATGDACVLRALPWLGTMRLVATGCAGAAIAAG